MIGIYLAGLATGGGLLLFSIAAGGGDDGGDGPAEAHGAEAHSDLDSDVEVEVEVEADGGHDADEPGHEVESGSSMSLSALALTALPVASLRFWTFFLAFGGLTGTLLTWLSPLGAVATAILSALVGYVAGVGVSLFLRAIARDQVSSTVGLGTCVGASGVVVLPVVPGERGRVRVALENQMVDFDAETDDDLALAAEESVFIYAVRDDGVVLVSSRPNLTRTN